MLFHVIGIGHDGFATCLRQPQHRFQEIRIDPVVRIHEIDIFSLRLRETTVPGTAVKALLLQTDHAQTGVSLSLLGQDGRGIIRRQVIDAEDFNVAKGLAEDGVQAFPEIRGRVIDRNDDADTRFHGSRDRKQKMGRVIVREGFLFYIPGCMQHRNSVCIVPGKTPDPGKKG